MAIRLTATRNDRDLRHGVLGDGTHLVGSAPEADLVVTDPTVSRRHLELEILDQVVRAVDLGSSNGTSLHGVRVAPRQAVEWPQNEPLMLGEVQLVWTALDQGDDSVALALTPRTDAHKGRPDPTLELATLSRFANNRLPRLLHRLRAGIPRATMAREVGEALVASTACSALRILTRDGGVLFAATREPAPVDEALRVEDGTLAIELSPGPGEIAAAYRPLLDTALSLMALATPSVAVPVSPPEAAPPAPETLDPAMRRIYHGATRAARGRLNVLIRGESGTGKEVFARHLHTLSAGAGQPFVAINCSALPEHLLEAELFGIERGVATGVDARAGKFEQAHEGVLFLDEIGDMPPATQAKILRALQEQSVVRLGASKPRPARVMVIAATNRDIDAMIAEGAFRLDLFHRLADWEVELPPLRERMVDLPNFAVHFLEEAVQRLGTGVAGLSQRALDVLTGYDWPGNIRQLQREMHRLAAFADPGHLITSADLDPRIAGAGEIAGDAQAGDGLEALLADAERRLIAAELKRQGDNISRTAEALQVSRSKLYRRMRQLGLHGDEESETL